MLINIPFTLAQIRAATKAQIITKITEKLNTLTKRQIIIWLFENVIEVADEPIIVVRPDGQIASQVEVMKDVETAAVLSTKTITWTYYPTGEVDKITINENGKIKIIKHYTDGRQPEVENDL